MIIRVESSEYILARAILQPLEIHLAVAALLDQSTPGEIFIDDLSEPKSVFAYTMRRFFLAGQANNFEFNVGVRALFQDQIYPLARENELEGFTIFYAPDGWSRVIKEFILKDKYPIKDKRHYYTLSLLERSCRVTVPPGFSLVPIDEELLARQSLGNLEQLREEMGSERPSVAAFLDKSFGYCLIHGGELVAWCLSEYNTGTRCEVGIETRQRYQRRGLASITATALAEKAKSMGLTEIGWHCYERNQASIATALKLGYRKVCEYPAYWGMFDEALSLAVNGNACFERQDYAGAIEWYLEAVEDDESPAWVHWNAACAYAHLDDKVSSFRYLFQAIERGFRDLEFINESRHFIKWHDTPEWTAMIGKLENEQIP